MTGEIIVEMMKNDFIIYSLDSPKYHLLKLDSQNTFSGSVLNLSGPVVKSLNVYSGKRFIGNFAVNSRREIFQRALPWVHGAETCGFDFELFTPSGEENLLLEMVFSDGSGEFFVEYDLSFACQMREKFMTMNARIDNLNFPSGDIVYLTQGHKDVKAYKDSIVPCVINMKLYLEHSGVDTGTIASILDFGCGSGRALVGWYADGDNRELFGCDINEELVAWARENLPGRIHLDRNSLVPPLSYPDQRFDLVYLVSVFTHLSLDVQRLWIHEVKRILRRGGYLLMTLQGALYVYAMFKADKEREFLTRGYIEYNAGAEGSSDFGAFHSETFVREMFSDFEIIGYFPNGKINGRRTLFQIAAMQDVYVLRRKRDD